MADDQQPTRPWRLYLLAGVFVVLATLALAIDVPVARWARTVQLPGDVSKAVSFFECFAHGFGVALILLILFAVDPSCRRGLARVTVCAAAAGLAANLVKLAIGRTRPSHIQDFAAIAGSMETFEGWFPRLTEPELAQRLGHGIESFPSGHTATAVGFAIGLAFLYPQGRWVFALLAVFAGLQRILAQAHYPSDTLAGAAVACILAGSCVDRKLVGRWFDRFERPGSSNAEPARAR